jgi:hypothetical protein
MHAEQNYIYIVFAVLYIIYSIVQAARKGKKQKQAAAPPNKTGQRAQTVRPPASEPAPHSGDDIKRMLEDLLGGSPEVPVPEKQAANPRPVQASKEFPSGRGLSGQPAAAMREPAKLASAHSRREKRVTPAPIPFIKEESPHFISHPEIVQQVFAPVEVKEEEAAVDFDIRQAVLYSEILKRPQY